MRSSQCPCARPPSLPAAVCPLQEFGGAIADASKALELDPKYAKGFYRRGDASYALGHFKDAVRDFRAAIRLAPGDPDLRRKVWRCVGRVERRGGRDVGERWKRLGEGLAALAGWSMHVNLCWQRRPLRMVGSVAGIGGCMPGSKRGSTHSKAP